MLWNFRSINTGESSASTGERLANTAKARTKAAKRRKDRKENFMAYTQDFIPARDAEFDGWLANLASYVNTKTSSGAWTHIPPDKGTALNGHNTDWHTAYTKTLGSHTSVDTEEKNDNGRRRKVLSAPLSSSISSLIP
jgi:hypothetical protein